MDEPPRATRPRRRTRWLLVVAGLVAVLGLGALGALRLGLPPLEHYRPDVEAWASRELGHGVRIEALTAQWTGWTPTLRLDGVHIQGRDRPAPEEMVAGFASASVTLDPIASLRHRALHPARIRVRGASLTLAPGPGGGPMVVGLGEHAGEHGARLATWLLAQPRVHLEDATVHWRPATGPSVVLEDTSVNLQRMEPDRHRIDAEASVGPGGGRLRLVLDLLGDPLSRHWSGSLEARAEGIDPGLLGRIAGMTLPALDEAALDLEMRGGLRHGRLDRADGALRLRGLGPDDPGRGLRGLEGRVAVQTIPGGWLVELTEGRLQGGTGDWSGIRASGRYLGAVDGLPARLRVGLSRARVEDLLATARALLPGGLPFPEPGELGGELRGLEAAWQAGEDGWRLEFAGADLQDLHLGVATGGPVVRRLAGRLELEAAGGFLDIRDAALDPGAQELFPPGLAGARTRGRVAWGRDAGGLTLEARALTVEDDHAALRISGFARWPPGARRPYVDALGEIRHGALERLGELVPTTGLPDGLRHWLRTAFAAGRVPGGSFRVQGDFGIAPGEDGGPRWRADLEVVEADLEYAPGWPPLTGAGGRVSLRGTHLEVALSEGWFSEARVTTARAGIADVAAEIPILTIEGHVDTRTEHAHGFLASSPLEPEFRQLLGHVEVLGPGGIDLELRLPLAGPRPGPKRRVRGVLHLADNQIALPGLEEGLDSVRGRITFDDASVRAEAVEARYLGRPLALEAESLETTGESGRTTRIGVRGTASGGYLLNHLRNAGLLTLGGTDEARILERVDGEADFRAEIDVPHGGGGELRLAVTSDLQGAVFRLPEPLGKSAPTMRRLEVETRFPGESRRSLRVRYGDVGNAWLELGPGEAGLALERGVVHFGAEPAGLPPDPGLVLSGRLPHLALGEWQRLLERAEPEAGIDAEAVLAAPATPGALRRVDLELGYLEVGQHGLAGVRLRADPSDDGWTLRMEGAQIDGEIHFPFGFLDRGVEARFRRLALEPLPLGSRPGPPPELGGDPRRVPPLRLHCAECRLGERRLGSLDLVTRRTAEGLAVDSLEVRSEALEIEADGDWHQVAGEGRTRLRASVRGSDLGGMLAALGYEVGALAGGATTATLDAAWPGSPKDLDLAQLEGGLRFRSEAGRLLDVRRGATGRLFGLLTITSLHRRLLLDFRDLLEEGLAFDYMEGSFRIAGGQARTDDLTIDGPSARIEVSGRTGLVDEDYDQNVTVTPKLSSSLPFAPVWLAEKVLGREIFDRAFAVRYTITGTWAEPVIEREAVEEVSPGRS